MASMCRSAALAAVRSSALRSQILLPKASPSRLASPLISRPLVSALGTVESLWPLHSAVASARLVSNIAVDSSCWAWPSQVVSSFLWTKEALWIPYTLRRKVWLLYWQNFMMKTSLWILLQIHCKNQKQLTRQSQPKYKRKMRERKHQDLCGKPLLEKPRSHNTERIHYLQKKSKARPAATYLSDNTLHHILAPQD